LRVRPRFPRRMVHETEVGSSTSWMDRVRVPPGRRAAAVGSVEPLRGRRTGPRLSGCSRATRRAGGKCTGPVSCPPSLRCACGEAARSSGEMAPAGGTSSRQHGRPPRACPPPCVPPATVAQAQPGTHRPPRGQDSARLLLAPSPRWHPTICRQGEKAQLEGDVVHLFVAR